MKRLIFRKRNVLEWEEVEEPKITEQDQAIVKPITIARCDLDLAIFRGQTFFRPPFPVGHEFVGEILEVSENLKEKFKKGDRVIIPFQISCGKCESCLASDSKSCDTMHSHPSDFGMGSTAKKMGGAVAEQLLIPYASHMLMPIKKEINPISIASISDNIVEAWKMVGIHTANSEINSILVQGGYAPSIGLYSALLGKAMGKDVTYSDFSQERLSIANNAGIKTLEINEYSGSLGKFDLVADASGVKEGFYSAIKSVRSYGKVTSASVFFTNSFPIPFLEIYDKGVEFTIGRVNSFEWIPKVLEKIEQGNFPVEKVVTQIADFSDAKEAMLEETTKLVIKNINT